MDNRDYNSTDMDDKNECSYSGTVRCEYSLLLMTELVPEKSRVESDFPCYRVAQKGQASSVSCVFHVQNVHVVGSDAHGVWTKLLGSLTGQRRGGREKIR